MSLQWGRDLTVTDRTPHQNVSAAMSTLQWGRDLTVTDRAGGSGTITIRATLQWGRDLTVTDSAKLRHCGGSPDPRFNGAAT